MIGINHLVYRNGRHVLFPAHRFIFQGGKNGLTFSAAPHSQPHTSYHIPHCIRRCCCRSRAQTSICADSSPTLHTLLQVLLPLSGTDFQQQQGGQRLLRKLARERELQQQQQAEAHDDAEHGSRPPSRLSPSPLPPDAASLGSSMPPKGFTKSAFLYNPSKSIIASPTGRLYYVTLSPDHLTNYVVAASNNPLPH